MKITTGHLAEKSGKWYAVINLYDADGKRHEKWRSLGLDAKKGTKTEANHRLNEVLEQYNLGDQYLHEGMSRADKERNRIADMRVEDYLAEWLESYKGNITKSTYTSYKRYMDVHMIPFFKKMKVKVKEITGDEINEYYAYLRAKGLKGTSCQRHHSLLHLAFKSAMKRRIIPTNPVDQADRPKSVQFIGNYYNAEEIKQLIDCTKDDPLHIVIIIAAYYGLRRSEIMAITADDLDGNILHVTKAKVQNENREWVIKTTKTPRSRRDITLPQDIADMIFGQGFAFDCYPSDIQKVITTACKRLKINHITLHKLRHYFATKLLSENVDVMTIAALGGWSSPDMIYKRYGHSMEEKKKNALKHINSITVQ